MNILITGASRGIGYDTALELAKDPANNIIALARNSEGLNKLLQAGQQHSNIKVFVTDITRLDQSHINHILAPYKTLDVLINNAGQLINKKFTELSIDEWRQIFEANLFGTVNIINIALPYLKKAGLSHIVNISSMGGFQGTSKFEGLSAYSASKAALCNLTECLAEELKATNIRVNCLALGAVATEMLKSAFPDYTAPLTAAAMAKFIANFSLTSHHYMNGKILPVSVNTP